MAEKISVYKETYRGLTFLVIFLSIILIVLFFLFNYTYQKQEKDKDIYYHALEISLSDLRLRTYKQGICENVTLDKSVFAKSIGDINYTDNYIRWAKGLP